MTVPQQRTNSRRSAARRLTMFCAAALTVLIMSVSGPPAAQAAVAPTFTATQFGHLGWYFATTTPPDKVGAITDAMNTAVTSVNLVADFTGSIPVSYNPGVPTAQASFGGWIEFGGTISAGVAQHELGHWLGSGTYWDFDNHISNGAWTGPVALSRLGAYDGPKSVVNTDGTHFWPYGWNYPNEYTDPQREIGMVSAFRADMGLTDGTAAANGAFKLQNRSNQKMLDLNTASTGALQKTLSASTSQTWKLTAKNGYWSIINTKSSKALDGVGRTTNGSSVTTATVSTSLSQQWEIVPTDTGHFLLRNRKTSLCLDTGGLGSGATLQNWACGNGIWNQQWQLGTS